MKYKSVVFDTAEAITSAFFAGRCQVYTTDMSDLAGARTKAPKADDYVILPQVISKEPLGPSVRRGDDEWFQIVRWTLYAMIDAEENGLTQANVDEQKTANKDPNVQRFLGVTEDTGKLLGLDKEWAYRVVKQVGNYGESFERNLGPKSPVGLPRGVNNLWTQGRPDVRAADPLSAEAAAPVGDAAWRARAAPRAARLDRAGRAALILLAVVAGLAHNVAANLEARQIRSGFDFLRDAGRLQHRRAAVRVRVARQLRARVRGRHGQHAARRALRHRAGERARRRGRLACGCRATRSCCASAPPTSRCSATSRC